MEKIEEHEGKIYLMVGGNILDKALDKIKIIISIDSKILRNLEFPSKKPSEKTELRVMTS